MNDFDTFWHEAKAALRVALQWFFLAVPMGLLCGFLGTLFHLAVEHATELRAAQPWLLFLLPVAGLLITALYKVTKCEGVGTAFCWCPPSFWVRCSPTCAAALPAARALLCRWAAASATTSPIAARQENT